MSKGGVVVFRCTKAQLGSEHLGPGVLESGHKAVHSLGCGLDRGVPVVTHQGQERGGELGKVPHQNIGLLVIRVASEVIDR